MRLIVVLLALAFAASAQARGNAESGKAKAAQVCAACHGPDGNKPSAPDQPVLAGQYYDYLVRALSDYKAGHRTNGIMKGFAATLSTCAPGSNVKKLYPASTQVSMSAVVFK